MVERKLYKTKLCMLYQRGRCSRQYCNFAHGDAELRRSFNGRQEYRRGRDLRERLDKMRSPLHNSPARGDVKTRHSSQGDSPRSFGKRIDRNHKKRKQLESHTDYSGRISDGTEDQIRDRRQMSSETKFRIDEQLREMHSEIKVLEGDKRQLEIYLEDKGKEADTLTMKIHELEMQLSKEKEEGKRFTTKIKKFIKAHNRHMRLQDELKRSHAQLLKLGEQLDLNAVGAAGQGNEDDSKINTMSDDVTGGYPISPLNEGHMNSSPHKKRSRAFLEAYDASNQGIAVGGRTEIRKARLEKFSRHSESRDQLSNSKKAEADHGRGSFAFEDKSDRGINPPADIASTDKNKVSETGLTLPSTGIAAHAMDEDVEVVEMDDKFQAVGPVSAGAHAEANVKITRSPLLPPPPPPVPQNAYVQYKDDDENVDVDGVDEDTVEVDIV